MKEGLLSGERVRIFKCGFVRAARYPKPILRLCIQNYAKLKRRVSVPVSQLLLPPVPLQ